MQFWVKSFRSHVLLKMIKMLQTTWNKPKGVHIDVVDGDEDSKRNASSILTITNVTESYGGKYKCTVNNGERITTNFKLIVEGICGDLKLTNVFYVQ